ncbi:MAG: sulfatase [Opitutaceae bacterium]|nr:sulfatase [Opitutaceae bacterium]
MWRYLLLLGSLLHLNAVSGAGQADHPRPNILMIVADDWSFPHAGIYGNSWVKTPAFDRFAREGLLFTRAYTPVAKCSPSRASLLTGRNPWQLDEAFAHRGFFPLQYRTYSEALGSEGYVVGYTGKGWSPGVALTADHLPRRLLGSAFDRRTLAPPTSAISRNDYAGNFGEFLKTASTSGSPWCFWIGASEPHRPYEYGSGAAQTGRKPADLGALPAYWPEDDRVRNDVLDYGFEVEHFDRQLQRILQVLAEQGAEENTLVVVTSDNGMPFPRSKSECYEISNHVPLALRWPRGIGTSGRNIEDYVSLIDLAPTILDAARLDWNRSGMKPLTGRSLMPLLHSSRSGRIETNRDFVLIGRERNAPGRPLNQGFPSRGIIEEDWLYIENAAPDRWPGGNPETGYLEVDTGPSKSVIIQRRRSEPADTYWQMTFGRRSARELYNLKNDPDCIENLISSSAHHDRAASLQARLQEQLTAQGDPRQLGKPDYFDSFPFSYPAYNDFYERWASGQAKIPDTIPRSDIEPNPLPELLPPATSGTNHP